MEDRSLYSMLGVLWYCFFIVLGSLYFMSTKLKYALLSRTFPTCFQVRWESCLNRQKKKNGANKYQQNFYKWLGSPPGKS